MIRPLTWPLDDMRLFEFRVFQIFFAATVFCAGAARAETAPDSRFALHSDPWINLHHFLYHVARNTLRGEERLRGRVRISAADREVELSGDEAQIWQEALNTYAALGDRDLLFDTKMQRIRQALANGEAAVPVPGTESEFDALRAAMPIYRRHWWPVHDQMNHVRMSELRDLLDTYEQPMAARLAEVYESAWPHEPIRVDLSAYGGRHGAYTSSPPDHIVMASGPEWYPRLYGLEILFHETGHLEAFEAGILRASNAGAAAAGVEEGRAWHAFMFYVPATAAKDLFPGNYVPYPWRYGLFTEGSTASHLPHMEKGMAEGDSLAEVLRILHASRAAVQPDEPGDPDLN